MVLLQSTMVPLGTPAPDFSLKGIDEKQHSLADYSSAKVLVMIFMCNHCPYVQKIWDDLVALEGKMPEQVQFVGVNSNANPDYPEDSFEKMKEYAAEKRQNFPYLYDEGQEVSNAYGAQCTPDIFVYDSARELAYRGSFAGLELAISAMLNDEKPPAEQKVSIGCSIKWN